MNPILFSHIPKTAGTSFRVALEDYFGENKILADYGLNSERTSSLVRNCVYDQGDRYALLEQLDNFSALSGHIKLRTYLPLFNIKNTVTLLRDPAVRVISEYRHFQRHMNYKGSLMEFARNNRNINLQSRYLMTVPLGSIGVVGISEDYQASLDLINQHFDLSLPPLDLNKAPSGEIAASDEERREIRQLNKKDVLLYQQAQRLFATRYGMLKKQQLYVFGGWRKLVKSHIIRGFAWCAGTPEKAIELEITASNQVWQCRASDLAELSKAINLPRCGFVGFQLVLPKAVDMSEISVRVASTGQKLLPQDYMG